MSWKFQGIRPLKDEIRATREDALREAKETGRSMDYPFVRSRGTFIATCAKNGDQCNPRPEASACDWDGTWREIVDLVSHAHALEPEVAEVYICGGYDVARSLYHFRDGDYEPWASNWRVTVWTRRSE